MILKLFPYGRFNPFGVVDLFWSSISFLFIDSSQGHLKQIPEEKKKMFV